MGSPSSRFTMSRQPAQRYQRAKGLKVKHVLQIAVIIIVLTWVVNEFSQLRKPADSQGQDRSAYRDTVQGSSSLGRKALKPEGKQGKFHLEKETPTDPDNTTTKSSLLEIVDGSRTKEEADDQRDKDISDLDIEHVSDQGKYFEEIKNEQARAEQEEVAEDGNDGGTEQDVDSQSLQNGETTSSTEGSDNHPASVVNGHKKVGHTTGVTFMETFNADSVLKHKLDKLDDGQVGDTSRAHVDEKFDSAIDALKEATEDSGPNIGEEKNVDPNEEVSEKEVDEEALDVSEVSTGLNTAENNADGQSEDEDTKVSLTTQSREQFDVNKEKLGVESREEFKVEEKVETEEQRQAPEQQQIGEEEKPEYKHDTLSHVQEEHESEEKKQEEELVEKKADNPQTEVNDTESNIQPELKSDGDQHEIKESLKNVAGDLDGLTQGSQGETKSLKQSEETDENKRRFATEKSIQDFLGTSTEEKEEARQNHGGVETLNGNESRQGNIEHKKDESAKTNQVETDSKGAGDLSDDSNSKVEKLIREDHSAETVNADASKKEDSSKKDEDSKDEVLKQVTDFSAAGSGESDKKVDD